MALLFAKDGHKVEVFEKRKVCFTSEGRRSNLLLGYRALNLLQEIGINYKTDKDFTGFGGINIHVPGQKPIEIMWAEKMQTVDR